MKFSIVTPALNSERFIGETIDSVLSQEGDFEIEYFVMDGKSSDSTPEIVERYKQQIDNGSYPIKCRKVSLHCLSKKDGGMYDAINKGLEQATGDIQAWVNSDDVYLPGAFSAVASVFNKYPSIQWVKGITSYIDEDSKQTQPGHNWLYARELIRNGAYGRSAYFIQQTSVFWQTSLWKKTAGIDPTLKLAGDYYLWLRFAEHAPLVSIDLPLACFRRTKGQLSENMDAYNKEAVTISRSRPLQDFLVRKFFRQIMPRGSSSAALIRQLQQLAYQLLIGKHCYYSINFPEDGEPVLMEGSLTEIDCRS